MQENEAMAREDVDDNKATDQENHQPYVIGCAKHMGKERSYAQQFLQELKKELQRIDHGPVCLRQAKSDRPQIKQLKKRDRSEAKPIVAEVYSRPRVAACVRMHYESEIIASKAYDTHTGYDFTDEKVRDAEKKRSIKTTQTLS